ncbi:MAG: dihydropteroate synthase [Actinobacteria bacterium]|nr:dihydropteroate synthase [Actinomycetota bacterium]
MELAASKLWDWQVGASHYAQAVRPLVMGVLNVTPDSFSDGGRFYDKDRAVERALEMLEEGVDIVDVGGESTRPGAQPVAEEEELRRTIPVIEALASKVRISVDTRKSVVARAALAAGATLVNDVSASLASEAARAGAGWIAMHMQGSPESMQKSPHYDDVFSEVSEFLLERATAGSALGIEEIWIDPGIGFGKTLEHNLCLLSRIGDLAGCGFPVMVGTSRKSFLGRLAPGRDGAPAPVGDRLEASVATAVWAVCCGASMVRVHDVAATVQAMKLVGELPLERVPVVPR